MEVTIQLDQKEYKAVNKYLSKVERNAKSLKPVLNLFVSVMANSTLENFRSQGRQPFQWRPLSARRIRERTAAGTWPGRILTEFGDLRRSLLPALRARGSYLQYSNTEVEYGTTLNRAARLHYGDPNANLPARQFLYFRGEDVDQIISYAYVFVFNPELAERFGRMPSVHTVPKNLFLGTW